MSGQNHASTSHLRDYFDSAATHYSSDIEPAFKPLVEELIGLVHVTSQQKVVDLGAGTGLVTRLIRNSCADVYALDFSMAMLRVARNAQPSGSVCASLHEIGIRPESFDLALASFAFNSTDPRLSLHEAQRILKVDAHLAFQEWGTPDTLSEIVTETLANYVVEDPPPRLLRLREQMSTSVPWDDLETPEEMLEQVIEAGFAIETFVVANSAIRMKSTKAFIRYKLAWPNRRAEVEAMADDTRSILLSDLKENIEPYAEADATLTWRPEIIRVVGRKHL